MNAFEYINKFVVSVLKPSRINGVGFFAVRDIKKGDTIFEAWKGESGIYSITIDELNLLPDDLKKNIYETFDNRFLYINREGEEIFIQKEIGKIFFPLERGFHWIYIWPKMFINSGLNKANVDTNNFINPIAIRDIKKGEELLANYGTNFNVPPKNFI